MVERERYEILLEDMRNQLKFVAESHMTLDNKLERHYANLNERVNMVQEIMLLFGKETRADFDKVHSRLDSFESRMDQVERRLDSVEQRLDRVEQRLDQVEQRLDRVEQRLDGVEHRLEAIENKLNKLDLILEKIGGFDIRLRALEAPRA